jgi:hypothetical protein
MSVADRKVKSVLQSFRETDIGERIKEVEKEIDFGNPV